jgi:gamma-glutamylcyclotransferase
LAQVKMVRLLNFAYGSNMLLARLRQRVPDANPIGVARLRGHQLRWHKVAKDDSGKCDVVTAEGESVVYGVLYEIPQEQKKHLDRAEGLGFGYEEKEVWVEVEATTYMAKAYCATKINPTLLPFA